MVSQSFFCSWGFLLYEIYTPKVFIRSIKKIEYFIRQSTTVTLFRTSTPAISHLVVFGRNPENSENKFRPSKIFFFEFMSFRKNIASLAYSVCKHSLANIFKLCIFLSWFYHNKNYFCPYLCLPFTTHDSWFVNYILIQSQKFPFKPHFFRIAMRNLWFKESNAFCKINFPLKYPLRFYRCSLSPINLPFT